MSQAPEGLLATGEPPPFTVKTKRRRSPSKPEGRRRGSTHGSCVEVALMNVRFRPDSSCAANIEAGPSRANSGMSFDDLLGPLATGYLDGFSRLPIGISRESPGFLDKR